MPTYLSVETGEQKPFDSDRAAYEAGFEYKQIDGERFEEDEEWCDLWSRDAAIKTADWWIRNWDEAGWVPKSKKDNLDELREKWAEDLDDVLRKRATDLEEFKKVLMYAKNSEWRSRGFMRAPSKLDTKGPEDTWYYEYLLMQAEAQSTENLPPVGTKVDERKLEKLKDRYGEEVEEKFEQIGFKKSNRNIAEYKRTE